MCMLKGIQGHSNDSEAPPKDYSTIAIWSSFIGLRSPRQRGRQPGGGRWRWGWRSRWGRREGRSGWPPSRAQVGPGEADVTASRLWFEIDPARPWQGDPSCDYENANLSLYLQLSRFVNPPFKIKAPVVTYIETPGPIDRTPETPGSGKKAISQKTFKCSTERYLVQNL